MTAPTAKQIKVIAGLGGLIVADDVAERIAHNIGPAYEGFAAIAGTLPMDLEPATFLVVQNTKAAK
ncbi:hypothetical protein [Tardiphaga sp.]|uniref:hypothetical protein n=1 Tax=Tardiphaga sp. TaxID=1926292 RepID=UPI0026220DC3|nr:hypothetical protein [Tardiphaga sp.]MDB5620795.1 hypothetical protein [Tardiphaga sp.]